MNEAVVTGPGRVLVHPHAATNQSRMESVVTFLQDTMSPDGAEAAAPRVFSQLPRIFSRMLNKEKYHHVC